MFLIICYSILLKSVLKPLRMKKLLVNTLFIHTLTKWTDFTFTYQYLERRRAIELSGQKPGNEETQLATILLFATYFRFIYSDLL